MRLELDDVTRLQAACLAPLRPLDLACAVADRLDLVIRGQPDLVALASLQLQDRLDPAAPEPFLSRRERLPVHDGSMAHADKLAHLTRTLVSQYPGVCSDAGVGAELVQRPSGRPHLLGHLAVEDARLAAPALDHGQELAGELELIQSTRRPDRRVVGVPALAVLALEVAAL